MNVTVERRAIATLVGTPKEVQAELDHSHADRVLVVSFDHVKEHAVETLTENLQNIASSMLDVLLERQESAVLERLADALVPSTPVEPRLLREAAMLIQARKAVLESGDWLTAAEVAKLAGLSTRNPSAQPNKWKKREQIFAIHQGGVDYYPGYGLDPNADFRPLKALAKVIEVFAGRKDGWGMAYWFRSPNSFLGGKRPQDLLKPSPEQVIAAAQDEIQEVAHG